MLHILILDGDPTFGLTLARTLHEQQDFPCCTIVAASEAEAYEFVTNTKAPFDVFLIDQHFGPGLDGIDTLKELLYRSPESGAIVFTQAGDVQTGIRAYEAGAYRYLHKPVDPQELLAILHVLRDWRNTRRERDGLKILARLAEKAQHALSLPELGNIIVDEARQFGFQRVRLWQLDPQTRTITGVSEYGHNGLGNITNITWAIDESRYLVYTLESKEPIIFQDEELGTHYLQQQYGEEVFPRSRGQWVSIPLWSGDTCLGFLILDNYQTPRPIQPHQREELTLLGQQVAAALERTIRYEQEQRRRRELDMVMKLGQYAAKRAAEADLDTLLRDIHGIIRLGVPVQNFYIALYDEQLDQLVVRFDIHEGTAQEQFTINGGLTGYIVKHKQTLLLNSEQEILNFRRKQRIRLKKRGKNTYSWMGVPLIIGSQVIGAMVVQDTEREHAYTKEDLRLFTALANQVAGAIFAAQRKEEVDQSAKLLKVLKQATRQLLSLAEERQEWLWHAMLTLATANYGLGFNRAMLFMFDETGSWLEGKFGVGHLHQQQARKQWQHDVKRKYSFDDYLKALRNAEIEPTPVDEKVRTLKFPFPNENHAFREVFHENSWLKVPITENERLLPVEFIQAFGKTEYAVFPVLVGTRRIGIVVVDNYHSRRPLREVDLDRLETLLSQPALVDENRRQLKASHQLVDVQLDVLADVADATLKTTLDRICESIRGLTRADNVVIYPVVKGNQELYRYDSKNAGAAGLRTPLRPYDRPSDSGITTRVLVSSELFSVPDLDKAPWYDAISTEASTFISREKVRAFLAIPIHHPTEPEIIGVLYFNYRTPQTFHTHDIERATQLAKLAGAAMRSGRAGETIRLKGEADARELQILQRVLRESLQASLFIDQEQLARCILEAAEKLLQPLEVRVGLLWRKWFAVDEHREPKEGRQQYFLVNGKLEITETPELHGGITGYAIQIGEDLRIDDVKAERWKDKFVQEFTEQTRSELDVLVRLEDKILGVINIESPAVEAFTKQHLTIIRRLADVAALAWNNFNRQQNLRNILDASQVVVKPITLSETLNTILEATRRIAPNVSAVTIWYRDPETKHIVPGPSFGVKKQEFMSRDRTGDTEVALQKVMKSSDNAIWAVDIAEEPRLHGEFVRRESIESVAAFPLRTDDTEDGVVGALFFNYRRRHVFSSEEKMLFPILATIAATSIRDALRAEQVRRLEVVRKINEEAGNTLDVDQTLYAILQQLNQLFQGAKMCIMRYDDNDRTLKFEPASRYFYPTTNVPTFPVDNQSEASSIVCEVARQVLNNNKEYVSNVFNVQGSKWYCPVVAETKSQLSLGLLGSKKNLLGVLVLESNRLNAFSKEDEELLISIGKSIGLVIERAEQLRELQFKTTVATSTAWAAEIAHDVSREVKTIHTNAYLLKYLLSEEHQIYAQELSDSAENLNIATQSPKRALEKNIFLDNWLETTIRRLANERKGVEVICYLQSGVYVNISPFHLERVLRHLVRNAVEAMPDKTVGVQLTLRSRRQYKKRLEVLFSNNGPNIPEDVRKGMFYERVSTKGKLEDDSGGLGLLFVRAALEDMGGTIRLLPERTEDGVTFALTLPVALVSENEESLL